MNEKEKNINTKMNDFFVRSKIEDSHLFKNINLLLDFCFIIFDTFKDNLDNSIEFDLTKMRKISFQKKIDLIQKFYKDHEIDIDLEILIKDGTIKSSFHDLLDFESNDEMICTAFHGSNYYHHDKKLIDIPNTGLITDSIILVHEFSHLRNQPAEKREELNDLLTESLAYAEEFIFADYLNELGVFDSQQFKRIIFKNFYNQASKLIPIISAFKVFVDMGSLSKDNYKFYYQSDNDYESIIEFLDKKSDNYNFYQLSWNVIAAVFATHMYYEYQSDKSFMKNIDKLHEKINGKNPLECFRLMYLSDLGEEDQKKLRENLERMKTEILSNCQNKKL